MLGAILVGTTLAGAAPLAAQSGPARVFTRADTLRGSFTTPERAWWNVTFYDLRVSINPADSSIRGSNGITYRVVRPAPEMQIDLMVPLEVDSIVQDGRALSFRREGNAFLVRLIAAQPPGSAKTITVHYHGRPQVARRPPWEGGFTWTTDSLGRPWVVTTDQGMGASVWWPNKDTQADEPDSQRIALTVPDPLVDASNGRLRSTTRNPDGTTTYEWFVVNPINNYAIAVAAGSYAHYSEVFEGEGGRLTLDYWPLDYHLEAARRQFAQARSMLSCFENWFGPYPWYEDGYKLIEVPNTGMEHQSAVAYGNWYANGYRGRDGSGTGLGLKWDFIIVHESAHESFGNNITAKDNADMWVHESFANYAENLYTECLFGKDSGAAYVIGTRRGIRNDRPIIPEYGVNAQGSGDMYPKGGNMLHTIRQIVGGGDDGKWRAILRGLNTTFRHRTVMGSEVEAYIQRQAGVDLRKVFDQYLRTTMIPALEYRLEGSTLAYRWSNVVPGFNMPVRVTVSDGRFGVIRPTPEWRRARVRLSSPAAFAVDSNYYVTARDVTPPPADAPYRDARRPTPERVRDLLVRMTLEEKFWQLYMTPGNLDDPANDYAFGAFGLQVTGPVAEAGADARRINAIQRFFVERTRTGIPIIPFDEAVHGLVRPGATVFPQAIALAATWDSGLVARVAGAVALEARSRGVRQVLSPVVNVASDVRWGRVEETYGEDPYLSAVMGGAFVGAFERAGVVTTPKHFVANVGEGGRDSYPIEWSERRLEEVFYPPFRAAVKAGARSIMTAYNSVDGVPATQNRRLLTDVLKRSWGFRGFVISDAAATGGATVLHLTEPNTPVAAQHAWEAGLDVVFQSSHPQHRPYLDAVRRRLVADSVVDSAVARVLTVKFDLGLFERPYVDPDTAGRVNGSAEHRALALEGARASIVLLKNQRGILPLDPGAKSLAVIGTDAVEARLGGYSAPGERRISILDGIRARLGTGGGGVVRYAPGPGRMNRDAGVADDWRSAVDSAVAVARASDLAVVVAGIEEGEFRDRSRLGLPGHQEELILAVAATGKPVVVALVGGSAITMSAWLDSVDAVLDAWYPGEQGGRAVAEVLFGDYNPAGRLPITFPVMEGQLPLVYNHLPTGRGDDYFDLRGEQPLFPFGFGLSYTTFSYSALRIEPSPMGPGDTAVVRCRVRNQGQRAGDEVVQLYLRDLLASVARPVLQLAGFQRVHLEPGEEREVSFTVTSEHLRLLDRDGRWTVEPGVFRVLVGSSSKDIRLRGELVVR